MKLITALLTAAALTSPSIAGNKSLCAAPVVVDRVLGFFSSIMGIPVERFALEQISQLRSTKDATLCVAVIAFQNTGPNDIARGTVSYVVSLDTTGNPFVQIMN